MLEWTEVQRKYYIELLLLIITYCIQYENDIFKEEVTELFFLQVLIWWKYKVFCKQDDASLWSAVWQFGIENFSINHIL
jgi:hypothetical protein